MNVKSWCYDQHSSLLPFQFSLNPIQAQDLLDDALAAAAVLVVVPHVVDLVTGHVEIRLYQVIGYRRVCQAAFGLG